MACLLTGDVTSQVPDLQLMLPALLRQTLLQLLLPSMGILALLQDEYGITSSILYKTSWTCPGAR